MKVEQLGIEPLYSQFTSLTPSPSLSRWLNPRTDIDLTSTAFLYESVVVSEMEVCQNFHDVCQTSVMAGLFMYILKY